MDALSAEEGRKIREKAVVKLGVKFPNYLIVIKELGKGMKGMYEYGHDEYVLDNRAPILIYGKTMCEIIFMLVKRADDKYYTCIWVNGASKKSEFSSNKIILDNDLTVDEWVDLLMSLQQEVLLNPKYMEIATKGYFTA